MALFSTVLSRGCSAVICRNFHRSLVVRNDELKKMVFYADGYYKMGLLRDDFANQDNADVKEALRRLPEDVMLQRKYRAIRAQQAEINNSILPKEQWTTYEDKNHDYLQPYLKEVIKEREEREEWEATH